MIRLRRPRLDDPAIIRLIQRELLPLSHFQYTGEQLRKEMPRRLKNGTTYVAADEENGEPFGFVHFMVHGALLYVDMLAIDRAFRGKGYGKTLMARCESAAKTRGCERAKLLVDVRNTYALHFYERLGYRTVRYMPETYCFEMNKSLSNPDYHMNG